MPVVAAIHGVCVGGGLELILACHYRIATRDEFDAHRISRGEARNFPRLQRHRALDPQAGPMAAMQAMLTGGMIRASVAKAQGFIDQLVGSPGELHWAARKAVLQKRRSSRRGAVKMLLTKWPVRGLLAGKIRQETAKKVREDHYPAPVPPDRSLRRTWRRSQCHEDCRDEGLCAADGLRHVAQSRAASSA